MLLLLSRFSRVRLCATPQTAAHQAPPSLGFSRQEHWNGCHFLLRCRKVKSESEVAQLCPTLSDPMDCSLPGSSVHAIFQARVLLGSNSFQFITGELMLLFIIPLPNLEKRNFGAQADKQPTQAKDYFKKRRPVL